MDFSFPCVGNLDDGIFDLGLEEDAIRDRVEPDSSSVRAPEPPKSFVLSPDALDLALMAFDVGEEMEGGAEEFDVDSSDENRNGSGGLEGTLNSPLCDTAISQQDSGDSPVRGIAIPSNERDSARNQNTTGPSARAASHKGKSEAADARFRDSAPVQRRHAPFHCGDAEQNSQNHKASPRVSPGRFSQAKAKRRGGAGRVHSAFPPTLPDDDCNGRPAVATSTSTSRQAAAMNRGGLEVQQSTSRRLSTQTADRSSLTDSTNSPSQWARRRAEACEDAVVALSVRREGEALAEETGGAKAVKVAGVSRTGSAVLDDTNVKDRSITKRVAATKVGSGLEKRRVSFSDGSTGPREEDADEGDDVNRVAQDNDLLARASELHSSVAGQLRSVNELLKRKSYFYIDTSWSPKHLPCPPTAWKGKGVGVNSDNGVGVETESNGNTPGTLGGTNTGSMSRGRSGSASSSDARNVVAKLDGRWVSAGSRGSQVGVYSIAGEKVHDPCWKNQDAGLIVAPLDRLDGQALFAIFDGHGTNGRQASHECMQRLPKYLVSASRSGSPASALRRSCQRLHRDLAAGAAGDCARSGTTLCAAVLTGRRLTVANVGDSGCLRLSRRSNAGSGSPPSPVGPACTAAVTGRYGLFNGGGGVGGVGESDAMAASRGTNRRRRARPAVRMVDGAVGAPGATGGRRWGLVAERLSRDHKPESKGELQRIQAAGGVVFPLPTRADAAAGGGGGGVTQAALPSAARPHQASRLRARDFAAGVPRVWTAGGDGPGLAMSRSIGDKMAHTVGVTYEPEISEIDLDPRHDVMLVLASDGVWDVLTAEDIREVAETHTTDNAWCPQELSADICRKAVSGWATVTAGGSDDITCLVIKTLNVLPAAKSASVSAGKGTTAKRRTTPTPTAAVAEKAREGL